MDAATATEDAIGKAKGARGRKDKQGQEVVIKMKELEDRIVDLVDLYNKAGQASDKLNDAVKGAAEKCGLQASIVKKFVVARAGENFQEKRRDAEQLLLCFEEIGLLGGEKE